MNNIILASTSPRRHMLMKHLGFEFEVVPTNYEEDLTLDLSEEELVKTLSMNKAKEVASRTSGLIVAGDTMVFCEGKRLGKPKDRDACVDTLRWLSGKMQKVISGVSMIDTETGKTLCRSETTNVWFRELTEEEIQRQADSEEAYDCAGAYKIQGIGATFVARTEGCYTNIVGFPVSLVLEMFKEFE